MPRSPLALVPLLALGLLAGSLLLAPPARAEDPEAPASEPLDRAEALVEAGRTDAAIVLLRDAVEAAGEDAAARALAERLADLLVAVGEPYAALQYLERLAAERGEARDHLRLAEALLAVARRNAATVGASSLQVTPYLLDALASAGRAADDEGLADRRRLLEGEVRWWQGDLQAALEAFDAVDPEGLEPPRARHLHEMRGQTLYRLGRPADAAAAFARAGNTRGEAAAFSAAGNATETARAYGALLAAGPYDPGLVDEAVAAARFTGAEARVLETLDALEGGDLPEGAASHLALARARLLEALGRTEEAAGLLSGAAEAAPDDPDPLYELGRLRYGQGDDPEGVDAAVEAWIRALARAPDEDRVVALLWDVAGRDYEAGWRSPHRLARSVRIQEALTAAAPDDGLAWANLGNTLRTAGRHEEAVRAYERALAAEPDDPGIQSDAGLALAAAERPDAALEAFLRAAEIDADHDAAHQNAARVYWRRGEDAEAVRHLARALETARRQPAGAMRYRFLVDRCWRTTKREDLR